MFEYLEHMANTNLDCGAADCEACHFQRTQGVEHSTLQCRTGSARVQAPAPITALVTPAQPLTVTLDLGDALAGGLTLQQLVAAGKVPSGASAVLDRLGAQLKAAALAAIKAAQP